MCRPGRAAERKNNEKIDPLSELADALSEEAPRGTAEPQCERFRTHDERDGHYEAVDVLVDGALQHTLDVRDYADLLRPGTWMPVAVSHATRPAGSCA